MKVSSLVFLVPIVQACGVAVHLELVERIIPLLPPRLAQYRDYVRSGAFYPDAFYDCQGQYDVAEDAHWPPFLGKGVELVHERRLRGEDTAQLEAFLVGILSHQISDVSWHSLGLFQGLLQAMADSEFDGDYDKAHSVLDIGGDMIQLSRRTPDRATKNAKWAYNVDDIVALVQKSGYMEIPKSSIHYCMARGQAAYTGELKVADVVHKRYSRKSPTMFSQLESYFTGGLTDMHEQIEECLPELMRWINSGIDKPSYWDICPVFHGRKHEEEEGHYHHGNDLFDMIEETLEEEQEAELEQEVLDKKSTGGEFIMEILRDSIPEVRKKLDVFNTAAQAKVLECDIITAPETPDKLDGTQTLTIGEVSHPQFGSSLLFWGNANTELVVGAPTENRVYIYDKQHHLKHTLKSPNAAKGWGEFAAHFGSATAVWDGAYLVVSSPGISELDIYDVKGQWAGGVVWPQSSATYGRPGCKMIGESLAANTRTGTLYVGAPRSDFNRTIEQSGLVYALPRSILIQAVESKQYVQLDTTDHVLHQGTQPYQLLGSTLALSPSRLLVGSPGTEEVIGFDYDTGEQAMSLRSENLNKYKPSGFGAYLVAANEDYLIVGAPAGSLNDKSDTESQEGVLTIYTRNDKKLLAGSEEFEWFGSTGVIQGDVAYIASAHAFSGEGMLWKVDLKKRTRVELGVPNLSFASGFGSSIATNGEMLAIGMPHFDKPGKARRGGVAITVLH